MDPINARAPDKNDSGAHSVSALADLAREEMKVSVVPSAVLTGARQVADAVSARVRPERQTSVVPASELRAALRESFDCFRDLYRFAMELNNLPPPAPERPIEVGQALLPLVIRAWEKGSMKENEQLAFGLYRRQHAHPHDPGRIRIAYPEWLKLPSLFLQIAPCCSELPSRKIYLGSSPTLCPALMEMQARLDETQGRLSDLEAKENKALERGRSVYAQGIAKLTGDVEGINEEIAGLFERLSDVPIDQFAPALACLGVKASLHPAIMAKYVEYVAGLEELLKAALIGPRSEGGKREKFGLWLPSLAKGKGVGVQHDVMALGASDLGKIRQEPELLCEVVGVYLEARSFLRDLMKLSKPFPELAETLRQGAEALKRPLSRFGSDGEKAWNALVAIADSKVKQAALALLAEPIAGKGRQDSQPHSIECAENLVPLRWVVSNYLNAPSEEEAARYLAEVKRSDAISSALCPALERGREALVAADFQELARLISDEMDQGLDADSLFALVAPLLLLDGVLGQEDAQLRLKNQIPEIDRLKAIMGKAAEANPVTKQFVEDIALSAVRKVTPSLHDYGQDMDLAELWEVVETFEILKDQPDILEGVAGNEGSKSGILLFGPLGVGKTHFVDCLATHLGIRKFVISPEEGNESSYKLMIAAARNKVKEAKAYAKSGHCCILFIDEAELMMANRRDPTTLQEQRELTAYLLQVINELRRDYPRVLVVAATNYLGQIDPGMLRDGRFDVIIPMKKPGPKMREGLIRSSLARERIVCDLTDSQMSELVTITEGFIPLTIIRTIISQNRIGSAKAERKGQKLIFDFDSLKGWFQAEKVRLEQTEALQKQHWEEAARRPPLGPD